MAENTPNSTIKLFRRLQISNQNYAQSNNNSDSKFHSRNLNKINFRTKQTRQELTKLPVNHYKNFTTNPKGNDKNSSFLNRGKKEESRPISTYARYVSTPTHGQIKNISYQKDNDSNRLYENKNNNSSNSNNLNDNDNNNTNNTDNNNRFLRELSQKIISNKIKKIVLLTGAGISCPSGIPDFRTPGTGLYDNLKSYNIPYPEAIFEINHFRHNPQPFFVLAKEIYPGNKYRPNKVHYFMRLLEQKSRLLRIYTQNIDGLERLAGISDSRIVESHGTFATATCIKCGCLYPGSIVREHIYRNDQPHCTHCRGIIKPDIVFFGENLPDRFYSYSSDLNNCDLVIVMGTSLAVQPFSDIINEVPFRIPRLLINKELVGVFKKKNCRPNDNALTGDIVESIDKVVSALGWENDLNNLINESESSPVQYKDSTRKQIATIQRRNFSSSSIQNRITSSNPSNSYDFINNHISRMPTHPTLPPISNNQTRTFVRNPPKFFTSNTNFSSSSSSDESEEDTSNSY